MSEATLFTPFQLGDISLKNRVVMAPMTRCRAPGNVPNEAMARYYSSRATAGLLITEGTSPSPNGIGYARIPGCYSDAQREGWQLVTEAVHAAGGRIFLQCMHTGRVSHPLNMPPGARILAPSAIALSGKMWTDSEGEQPYPVPEAMTQKQVQEAVEEYVHSARVAIAAGFDGVEVHAANGYLIDQFLNPASNQRQDEYGGTAEKRRRFALEVLRAVTHAIGAGRVGMRISPHGVFNDMQSFEGMDDSFVALAEAASDLGVAYLHVVDHSSMGAPPVPPELKARLRAAFKQALILSGGYDTERANAELATGKGDLVAFGRPYVSNPALVEKLESGSELTPPDPATFYTPGDKGYLDYPA